MPKDENYNLQTIDIPGVEIFSEGSWNGDKYSGSDLQSMLDAFPHVGFEPTVKAGHADGQDELEEKEYRKIFGAPALGYVSRIYRSGQKLMADLKQVPRRFASLIKTGTYKRVSSEIYWNYKDESTGKTYPRVLKSIAFLGSEIPALTSLKAIEALFSRSDGGAMRVYQSGREFRIYEREKSMTPKKYKVEQRGEKWCVVGDDGKVISEHASQEEAMAASGGDSKEKVMPKFQNNEGDVHMAQAEVKEALDALRAELAAKYESTIQEVKAGADKEKAALNDRIASLEKQAGEATEVARFSKIEQRMESLKASGKIAPVEAKRLLAIFKSLPEAAVHTYSGDDGKEVKESVTETLWQMFENRKTNLIAELSNHSQEARSYSNAQAEVISMANEMIGKDNTLSLRQAYAKIAKDEPELWRNYQQDVKGSH